jgi:hypothetical protein
MNNTTQTLTRDDFVYGYNSALNGAAWVHGRYAIQHGHSGYSVIHKGKAFAGGLYTLEAAIEAIEQHAGRSAKHDDDPHHPDR